MSLRRHIQVARAAIRGFRYRRNIGAPVIKEGLALLRRILTFWRVTPRVPLKTWKFRLRQCKACDIYDPIHRTCGDNTGLIEIRGTLYPNGCSCIVGVKASDPENDCTLKSYGLASKWSAFGISLDGETEMPDGVGEKK